MASKIEGIHWGTGNILVSINSLIRFVMAIKAFVQIVFNYANASSNWL